MNSRVNDCLVRRRSPAQPYMHQYTGW
uniref:Uncharacterized protein n=1 Tax=Anguilla anguilla TaxID=7936 RepID=A0A0E9PKQ7_ANGAN